MVSIYVVTHKKFDWEKKEGYIPIAVGQSLLNDNSCNWIKDNTNENISDKNSNYCELTAQYWVWKNDKDSDIVGLCHYRRFLSKSIISNQKKYILNKQQIENSLRKYDILLPYKGASIRGNLKAYCDNGFEKDIYITREVIEQLYPEYLRAFDYVFDSASTEIANMLITSRKIFDSYSEWLFDILFHVEKRVDLTEYSAQQARIFGYISERLLGVWLIYHDMRIKRFRILNPEEKYGLKQIIENMMQKVGFYCFFKNIFFKYIKNRVRIK